MPYGDLEAMRVQRFETIEDIDDTDPTIEEREEYELPVEMGEAAPPFRTFPRRVCGRLPMLGSPAAAKLGS